MSAFVVGHAHIDALLTWSIDNQVNYYVSPFHAGNPGGLRVTITDANASEVGRILLDENERSVRYRYPECKDDDLPGTIGESSSNYEFRRWNSPLAALSILKACDCLDYQCCETDTWEQSLAWAVLHDIRTFAVRRLPGYDNAPGWEFDREKHDNPHIVRLSGRHARGFARGPRHARG